MKAPTAPTERSWSSVRVRIVWSFSQKSLLHLNNFLAFCTSMRSSHDSPGYLAGLVQMMSSSSRDDRSTTSLPDGDDEPPRTMAIALTSKGGPLDER